MNRKQPEPVFDVDGKALGPYQHVELVYMGDPKYNPPAAQEPEPRLLRPDSFGTRGRPAPKPESQPTEAHDSESPLERHARKCAICRHKDREEIEDLFLHWHKPYSIAFDFKVPDRSIYRHAHATGLYEARQGKLRCVLDRILERSEDASLTGESIIRAVRAYTCLTDNNRWVEPPSRVLFSSQPLPLAGRVEGLAPAVIAVSPRLPAHSSEEIVLPAGQESLAASSVAAPVAVATNRHGGD